MRNWLFREQIRKDSHLVGEEQGVPEQLVAATVRAAELANNLEVGIFVVELRDQAADEHQSVLGA